MLVDATSAISGTFHDFGRLSNKKKIDYIFTNGTFENLTLVDEKIGDDFYISDHDALCIDLNYN